jgi:hypothetical protein
MQSPAGRGILLKGLETEKAGDILHTLGHHLCASEVLIILQAGDGAPRRARRGCLVGFFIETSGGGSGGAKCKKRASARAPVPAVTRGAWHPPGISRNEFRWRYSPHLGAPPERVRRANDPPRK